MGLKLFKFTYHTLLQQTRDTSSKLFLPKLLSEMTSDGKPILPIKADHWENDSISGAETLSAALAITWFNPFFQNTLKLSKAEPNPPDITQKMIDDATKLTDKILKDRLSVIPCPGANPSMSIKEVEIQGLANIKISSSEPVVKEYGDAYNAVILLDFNEYPSTGEEWNQQLTLSGTANGIDAKTKEPFLGMEFSVDQCLCFTSDKHSCVPLPEGVEQLPSHCSPDGFINTTSGQISISLTDTKISADTTIKVSPDNKNLSIEIHSLTMLGTSSGLPVFKIKNLGINHNDDTKNYVEAWRTFISSIVELPDFAKNINEKINDALNVAENRQRIESTLNKQLSSALDNVFDTPAGGGFVPEQGSDYNQVDQYILYRIKSALNSQNSQFYVPKLVLSSKEPILEPLSTGNIDIPGSYHVNMLGVGIMLLDVKLPGGLTINGFSNAVIPSNKVSFKNDLLHASLQIGQLDPGPTLNVDGLSKRVPDPPLKISSLFSMMIGVEDGTPLGPIKGRLNIKINNNGINAPDLLISLRGAGDNPNNLTLTFTNIILNALPEEIDIKINLDDEQWNDVATVLANQSSLKTAIINELNEQIVGKLPDLSMSVTDFVKSQLKKALSH